MAKKKGRRDNEAQNRQTAKTKQQEEPTDVTVELIENPDSVRIVPLGGMREIGKNMYAYQYRDEIVIVDCGIAFPEENMPGVDVIIPDFTWLTQRRAQIRGLFLTHGHEDHIGAVAWFLREFPDVPVYGNPMTMKLVETKLSDRERGGSKKKAADFKLQVVHSGDTVETGSFKVEFIHVNHSIADASALMIETPVGRIVHSGDFKVDYTPVHGGPIDLNRLAVLGEEGVLALVSESTNVEVPGMTSSEQVVGETFSEIFGQVKGRLFVATFSSNIYRIQQIITAAEEHNRKVAMLGRSMLNAFDAANSLNYIKYKPETIVNMDQIKDLPPDEVLIITTGSQGEPMSALTRIAFSEHRQVQLTEGDTVILSSSMIPGNEKSIYRVINELYKRGAEVYYETLADIHVSGHAYRDELKLMLNLVKPKFFIPMHGEFRHLYKHAQLAKEQHIPDEHIFLLNNGDILTVTEDAAAVTGFTEAAGILIDGSGIGDVDQLVLRDRLRLADDGIVSVYVSIDKEKNTLYKTPDVQAKGFIYESEIEEVIDACQKKIAKFADQRRKKDQPLAGLIRSGVLHNQLRDLLYQRTKRRPMIMISVLEV